MKTEYWASFSGGKDSLYMLNVILENPEKYPLNGVVHFELEIDFPFIHEIVNKVENVLKDYKIPLIRIKPRKTWQELYEKYGFPNRVTRWCNSKYKLDCKKQFKNLMADKNIIYYIGYCQDETSRYEKRTGEIYPLVEQGINEDEILEWAKENEIFNNYYKYNTRCGCMYCPMMNMIGYAYLSKYYPEHFQNMINMMRKTEKELTERYGHKVTMRGHDKYDADYIIKRVSEKYLPKLEEMEKEHDTKTNSK